MKTGELADVTDVKELSYWEHDTYKVLRWTSGSEDGETSEDVKVAEVGEADIIASQITGSPKHTIMIDLDVPARLVPSSTPGHTHLYIDTPTSWDAFCVLLDALVIAGVLEEGYANASKARGYTALRLPWIKKEASPAEVCRVEYAEVERAG